jgi:hypothetical protein
MVLSLLLNLKPGHTPYRFDLATVNNKTLVAALTADIGEP